MTHEFKLSEKPLERLKAAASEFEKALAAVPPGDIELLIQNSKGRSIWSSIAEKRKPPRLRFALIRIPKGQPSTEWEWLYP